MAGLIPDVTFVEIDSVLPEEITVFVLEGLGPMVFFLVVDVLNHGIEIAGTNGEGAIAALPGKLGKIRGTLFQPLRRRCFQLADQIGNGDGAGKADRKVDVILYAADAVAFAIPMPGDSSEIGVKIGTHLRVEEGHSVFCAKDDVDQSKVERLRHGGMEG